MKSNGSPVCRLAEESNERNKCDVQSVGRDNRSQLSSHLGHTFVLLEDIFQIKLSPSQEWLL